MVKEKDLKVIRILRQNSRERLTIISRKIKMPISTLYDRIKILSKDNFVTKFTAILNFDKLGYNTRIVLILKVIKGDREEIKNYLLRNKSANSLSRINNGFDFMAEIVTKNISETEDFLEQLEDKYKILKKQIYYVIDDLKREEFLSKPSMFD